MPVAALDLEDAPEAPLLRPLIAMHLRAGEEGILRGAAHQQVGVLRDLLRDDAIGRAVDAERLLAEQMLARAEDVRVELRRAGYAARRSRPPRPRRRRADRRSRRRRGRRGSRW